MSSSEFDKCAPVQIGRLLRLALDDVRRRIHSGVVAAGFEDVRAPHTTLFRWPGPDGRHPTEVAADVGISKQRVNDLLRDLERLGYLELQPDVSDSRAKIIRLTPRGKRLHQVAVGVHAALEDDWAAAIGRSRFEDLRAALRQLTDDDGTASGRLHDARSTRRGRPRNAE
jgi:DNA-binding MarR family transcriptional regulator